MAAGDQRLRVDVGDEDLRAAIDEAVGHHPADAVAAAGDGDPQAGEIDGRRDACACDHGSSPAACGGSFAVLVRPGKSGLLRTRSRQAQRRAAHLRPRASVSSPPGAWSSERGGRVRQRACRRIMTNTERRRIQSRSDGFSSRESRPLGDGLPMSGLVHERRGLPFDRLPARRAAWGCLAARNRRHRSRPSPAPSVTITRGTQAVPSPPRRPRRPARSDLLPGQVPAAFPIFGPGRQRLLFEGLTGFLAIDILRDRLAHDPVGRPPSQIGQMLHTALQSRHRS